ncbi:MAG: bifunctional folylpolyglutamate synthase/dihydrofolate synthase [Clostridia bacterium]|nr:bifunctional folylpolyglutamate synthase/dihydrofolate synthase [Clostridia bacterium]
MLKTEKECIDYIHSVGRFGKKAGLCNIKALLTALGNPHKELKCIHIAGTNGKGSVSSMLTNILVANGYKVGMNTSPFIEVFNERITINGVNIPGDRLVYYTNLVAETTKSLKDVNPIEFEIITAIGFLYFRDEGCDYAVIECGLGGLYDCTNVIESPEICVIASIGLDHTEILGDTIEEIAFQKAGIIKDGCKVVTHPEITSDAMSVIGAEAKRKNARLVPTSADYEIVSAALGGTVVRVGDMEVNLKLLGSYQAGNAALAVNAARQLGISDSVIAQGIQMTEWKCRFELADSNVIIDGAHNYQGICAFRDSVELYGESSDRVFIIGMLNDKDFHSCARVLASMEGKFIITDVPSARQTSGQSVYERIREYIPDARYVPDLEAAVELAIDMAGSDGMIYTAGSLYLAGAIRTYIKSRKKLS